MIERKKGKGICHKNIKQRNMFDEVMEEEGGKVRKGWESKSKEGKRERKREKEGEKRNRHSLY